MKETRVFVVTVEAEKGSDMSASAIESIICSALVNPETRGSLTVKEAK